MPPACQGPGSPGQVRPACRQLVPRAGVHGAALGQDDDLVGLRVFTTGSGDGTATFKDLSPIEPIGANRERLRRQVDGLTPLNGTPLYDVAQRSYDELVTAFDGERINAVVLLTDGVNDDGDTSDDTRQLEALLASVSNANDGENTTPVRIFTVAYGSGANPAELKRIAEASNATAYQATDATTIDAVFTSVISNF